MKKCMRTGLFHKVLSKILCWATKKAIESLPVIGPIYKIASLVNELSQKPA